MEMHAKICEGGFWNSKCLQVGAIKLPQIVYILRATLPVLQRKAPLRKTTLKSGIKEFLAF